MGQDQSKGHMTTGSTGNVSTLASNPPKKQEPAPKTEDINYMLNQSISMDDFELLTVVGKGSFGKVIQVRKRDDGKIYAMKILKKQQLVARKQVQHTQTERKVLAQINHPFVVSLRYAFQTQTKLYMVLDYFTGGELFFHLKSGGCFPEERSRFYAAEISLALQCLHEHGIIITLLSAIINCSCFRHNLPGFEARKRTSGRRRSYKTHRLWSVQRRPQR
jgi:serine/threonine protein kinase